MGYPIGVATPVEVHAGAADSPLEVTVLFTDIPATLAALRTAAQLAQGLSARIRLVALQCVPYPLPFDESPVNVQFLGRRFQTLAESAVDTRVEIRLCRDKWQALRSMLPMRSVVVIGRRSRWWPQPEDRLARKLRAAGHDVVRTAYHKDCKHA